MLLLLTLVGILAFSVFYDGGTIVVVGLNLYNGYNYTSIEIFQHIPIFQE